MLIPIDPKARALIFDIDGTLADTMSVHYKACQLVCKPLGFDFPLDFFHEHAGIPTLQVFEMLVQKLGLDLNGREIGMEKEKKYLELIHEVKPIKEIADIARSYYKVMPMALGTGSTRDIAEKTLKAAGLSDLFNVVITADDVRNHKPAPDTFLLGAEKLGIAPEFCQVFEDANPGLAAAKAAGMIATDIRNYIDTRVRL
jgi:HAD superfamily hydrolase (TIGR01509 family)